MPGPATTDDVAAAAPEPEPTSDGSTSAQPMSATEWCQSVYTGSGVVDYVLGMGGTVYDTEITGTITPGDDGESYLLMCGGYHVLVTVAVFPTSALADEGRARVAGITVGAPASIAGRTGDYLYTPTDTIGSGGATFSWETDLTDYSIGIILWNVAEIPEPGIQDVLATMVTTISDTPVPEIKPECSTAEESLHEIAAANSDELGLFEDGVPAVSEFVATLEAECGRDVAEKALSTVPASEYVTGLLWEAFESE